MIGWARHSSVQLGAQVNRCTIPRFHGLAKKGLQGRWEAILLGGMIRRGFLEPNIRTDLIALVRDGKAETRLTRRANALLLLDDGMSCEAIGEGVYPRAYSTP